MPASAVITSKASLMSVLISPTMPPPLTRVLSLKSMLSLRSSAARRAAMHSAVAVLPVPDIAVEDDQRVAVAQGVEDRVAGARSWTAGPRLQPCEVSTRRRRTSLPGGPYLSANPISRSPTPASSSSGRGRSSSKSSRGGGHPKLALC